MRVARLNRLVAIAAITVTALMSSAAHALNVGDKAPAFSLPATIGKQARNTDFPGKTLVLFFYIGAFTNT